MPDHHFTSTEIKEFTIDLLEQQMIDEFGLVCPSCSMYLLKNYCPDCGRKTIIPNFCNKCKIESSSQFCANCGSAIFLIGMDAKIYDYLSGNYLDRDKDIGIKLVSITSMLSDIQTQMSSLSEIELQTLTRIKKELKPLLEIKTDISLLSKKFDEIDEKIEEIDIRIFNVEIELPKSIRILNERISEFGNYFVTKVADIDSKVNEIIPTTERIINDTYGVGSQVGCLAKDVERLREIMVNTENKVDNINKNVNFIITNGVYIRRYI